jgi:alpha-galactosidase
VPNHQTGRITPIETRAVVAMAGSFGYELDLKTLSDDEKQAVSAQIKKFKKYGSLIHGGDYYRLSDPTKENFAVWEYVSEDKSEILVHGIIFRTEPNMLRYAVKLRGIDGKKRYRLDGSDMIYNGAALIEGGILMPVSWGDYSSVELHFTETEG